MLTTLSLKATQEQNAEQNALTAQGQYTDRYTKAIDQLGQKGDDRLQIRLGGIHALERLAHDSPSDQPTIIEVLTAFVRTNTNAPFSTGIRLCEPPTDIQAALTVLGRRNSANDNGTRVDLHYACLSVTDLTGANLAGAHLFCTNLAGAGLIGANLRNADLAIAHLDGALLAGADLHGADLTGAYLNGALLTGANLHDANLTHASHNSATRIDNVVTSSKTTGQWW
ncbi:pentapeptide repeat-containing protein [Actinocrispum wychmicini]|uniref:Pentapeptide repeat protein n=1 Tax=Actinocrispum wychmicini TaxID=1213861 RepID=A0A4R2J6Q1_9PSEU|nr:pentapeptide repeat-containing protein [Actinocrispum wychmicini]TCO54154.1 pentapeptide repeat protein [Actinocrispum wychmicini]